MSGGTTVELEPRSVLRSHRLLRPEEEVALARAAQGGDRAARGRMIESNVRLVVSIAQRYHGLGLSTEDLVQEGVVGLAHAVDRYDWRLGYRFSTYATWWIRQAMQRAIAREGRAIRLPAHVAERRRFLERLRSELRAHLGREPTVAELAQASDLPAPQVEATLSVPDTTSLDAALNADDGNRRVDVLPDDNAVDPELAVEQAFERSALRSAVEHLPPRERTAITLHFGLDDRPYTLEEVAATLGVTRERARQIQAHGLVRLAQQLKVA